MRANYSREWYRDSEQQSRQLENISYESGPNPIPGKFFAVPRPGTGLQDSSLVITFVDRVGVMEFVDDAEGLVLGYPRNALFRRSILDLIHPEDRAEMRSALSNTGFRSCIPLAMRFLHYKGSWRQLEGMVASQKSITGSPGVLLCLQDVTAKKDADLALRRQIDELTAERNEARAADLSKSQLLATISHEIRTPMNSVVGLTSLLEDTALDERQRELVTTIKKSGESLLTLINEVLDHAKLESGQMEVEKYTFDLHQVVQETIQLLAESARSKGLKLGFSLAADLPHFVHSDAGKLRQILVNLLGNAIKFTDRGAVLVRVETIERAGAEGSVFVRFGIDDTGVGIPEHLQSRLFKEFVQADSSTQRVFGGTGLGLAISKKLVELLGGEIGYSSSAGEGSTFWFKIRLERARQEASILPDTQQNVAAGPCSSAKITRSNSLPATAPPIRPKLKGTILLVEDNPANQKVGTLMLQRLGLGVDLATDGVKAVEAFSRSSYSAILMDCQMPQMDGLEATRQIRRLEKDGARTPIIALTANVLNGERERCLSVGMDDYIAKPINADTLAHVLGSWITGTAKAEPLLPAKGAMNQDLLDQVEAFVRDMYGDMDPGDLLQFLDMLSASVPNGSKDVIGELAAENLKGASHAAHRLRNSAGAVGARELCDALQRMEQSLEDADTLSAKREVPLVKRASSELAAVLTKLTTR